MSPIELTNSTMRSALFGRLRSTRKFQRDSRSFSLAVIGVVVGGPANCNKTKVARSPRHLAPILRPDRSRSSLDGVTWLRKVRARCSSERGHAEEFRSEAIAADRLVVRPREIRRPVFGD